METIVKTWEGVRTGLYKGNNGDTILCDMDVEVIGGIIKVYDSEVKFDKSNPVLIEKLKKLRKRRRVCLIFKITYTSPYFLAKRDLSNGIITDILLEKEYKQREYENVERERDKFWNDALKTLSSAPLARADIEENKN